jgi:hypothetical protein
MDVELASVEVSVVCVVVVWEVVELGDVDCELGDVAGELDVLGVDDCGEELGDVCATAQTADSNKIAVIKVVFLITSSWF